MYNLDNSHHIKVSVKPTFRSFLMVFVSLCLTFPGKTSEVGGEEGE